MTENPNDRLRAAAEDQARLNAMPEAERDAEISRRAELFKADQATATKTKAKDRFMAKARGWLVVIVGLGAVFLIANLWLGGTTSVDRLDVADCFMFPEEGEAVDRIETPDCTEPHDGQIFHEFRPGDLTAAEFDPRCLGQIDSLNLADIGDGQLTVGHFAVSRENSSSVSNVICWVAFDEPFSASVVADE